MGLQNRLRRAQRCLAAGTGRWEPIGPAEWSGPPYTLRPKTYESKHGKYAPHLCDRGLASQRAEVKWRWVPEGSGCAALPLGLSTHSLAAAFCRRHANASILVVGESVQAPLFLSIASILGVRRWLPHTCSGRAVPYEIVATASVCAGSGGAPITVRYVSNEGSTINASREAVEEVEGDEGSACATIWGQASYQFGRELPFLRAARRSDFVLVTSPLGYQEPGDAAARLRASASLAALTALRPQPRVVVRGPAASLPPGKCKKMTDPLPAPFEFNLSDPQVRASRAVALFRMHTGKSSNEEARALTDGLAAGQGAHLAYLDVYRATAMRPGGRHNARKDCTHWCLPGPIDDWTRQALAWWLIGSKD